MDYLVVCGVALFASALTLVSGFGLGTLMLPAFALFFPLEIAVSATAIVHLANNIFKLSLIWRNADGGVVLRFGPPAVVAAFGGAWILSRLTGLPALVSYELGGRLREVTPIELVIAVLILIFAIVELLPASGRLSFHQRWIPLGGLVSGFFGGLSGHQGALRSAFLIQAGLGPQGYVATGVVCAVLVDVARLIVYGGSFLASHFGALEQQGGYPLVVAATLAAFVGAFVGLRVLGKMTLPVLRRLVGALLVLLALGLGGGLI